MTDKIDLRGIERKLDASDYANRGRDIESPLNLWKEDVESIRALVAAVRACKLAIGDYADVLVRHFKNKMKLPEGPKKGALRAFHALDRFTDGDSG